MYTFGVVLLIDFTDEDLLQIPNTISITRQIGESHFGLGSRVAFLKIADIANMGCMEVGISGVGKTASLLALERMHHRQVFTRKFTLAGVKQKFNDYFSHNETTWINYELTDLSELVMENMLKVVCDLLTDHSCQIITKQYSMDITDANISWIAACNFEIYNKLWNIAAWRGNFKDRILRYFTFAFQRKRVNPNIPRAAITMNFPKEDEIYIDTDMFEDVVVMLESQFTYERAYIYAERLLRASAALNHRSFASDADAKFILLHGANISAERWASQRETLTGPLQVDLDALFLFSESLKMFGVDIEWIAKQNLLKVNGKGKVISLIFKNPTLFVRDEDQVFPSHDIMAESILPQVNFERMCVLRGDQYYLK